MKNPGIYILTNQVNGMQYVGKDSNLPSRVDKHFSGSEQDCRRIHNAIKKYGHDAFSVEIIQYHGISQEALNAVERWKIKQLHTLSPNGYNLTKGGEGTLGFKHSKDTCEKISKNAKKRVEDGTHNLLGGEINKKRVEDGTHNFLGAEINKKRVANGTHPFLGGENNKKRLANGTHPFQNPKVHQKRSERIQKELADGTHPFLNYVGDNNPMKDPKVRQKNVEANRSPSYESAYQLFCALSETQPLREIRKTLFDQFVGVRKSTIYEWVRKWHSEKNPNYKPSNRSPSYEPAYQLFCALSKHLTVPEIRKTLYEQFPEVDKRTIRRWVQKWHSEVSHDSTIAKQEYLF